MEAGRCSDGNSQKRIEIRNHSEMGWREGRQWREEVEKVERKALQLSVSTTAVLSAAQASELVSHP